MSRRLCPGTGKRELLADGRQALCCTTKFLSCTLRFIPLHTAADDVSELVLAVPGQGPCGQLEDCASNGQFSVHGGGTRVNQFDGGGHDPIGGSRDLQKLRNLPVTTVLVGLSYDAGTRELRGDSEVVFRMGEASLTTWYDECDFAGGLPGEDDFYTRPDLETSIEEGAVIGTARISLLRQDVNAPNTNTQWRNRIVHPSTLVTFDISIAAVLTWYAGLQSITPAISSARQSALVSVAEAGAYSGTYFDGSFPTVGPREGWWVDDGSSSSGIAVHGDPHPTQSDCSPGEEAQLPFRVSTFAPVVYRPRISLEAGNVVDA